MSRVIPKPPYTLLARYYDCLAADAVAMNRHARGKVLGEILRRARVVCDLGCGTGSTAIELARAGQKVYAVDLSPEMCRRARQKARRARQPIKVFRADMCSLRLPERVDLVLCEFNPLNHLPRKSDLLRTFRAVARNLQPGGWFCFDLNTRRSLRKEYPGVMRWTEEADFCLLLRGDYDSRRDTAWLDFDWFIPSDSEGFIPKRGSARRKPRRSLNTWCRYQERVVDISWSDPEIRRALRQAGFARIRRWDGADVRPPSHRRRRGYDAYYRAQKPARS